MVLRGPEGMLRIEPRSVVYKAGTLPARFVGVSLSLCVLDLELFPFYYWENLGQLCANHVSLLSTLAPKSLY